MKVKPDPNMCPCCGASIKRRVLSKRFYVNEISKALGMKRDGTVSLSKEPYWSDSNRSWWLRAYEALVAKGVIKETKIGKD
jgi:hypothetical protein